MARQARLAAMALVPMLCTGLAGRSTAQQPSPVAAGCSALITAAVHQDSFRFKVASIRIDDATPVAAAERQPAFCQVRGRMMPIDPAGWPIIFQLNMPDRWNGGMIQLGGGGTNGVLVTGLNQPAILPPDAPTLLTRGFATLGTDAGHPMLSPDPQAFAANAEAVENQAYAAYKKVYDVARALVPKFYGRAMGRAYFIGNSEGGREALIAAQRYPEDYAGIVATVPAMDWTGQHIAHYQQWLAQRDGGWLSSDKVLMLSNAVLNRCDALDGLKDGVVAQQVACERVFRIESLACPAGESGAACLDPRELRFVRSVYDRVAFPYPIANGVRSYPGSPFGGEAQEGGLAGSLMVRSRPLPGDLGRPLPGPGSIRYFFTRDPEFTAPFDMTRYKARVLALSAMFDPTNPDLRSFAKQGKLLVIDYGADYLKSPYGSRDYYLSVRRRMGVAATDRFLRYYIIPGLAHSGKGMDVEGKPVPNRIDVVSLIQTWVEQGIAPESETLRSYDAANALAATRPMCRFPSLTIFTAGRRFKCSARR